MTYRIWPQYDTPVPLHALPFRRAELPFPAFRAPD
ncbi:Uncharacterised protein [Vibrio cholerae]|nr:Uncharacterised protein [Vibrio cholerae]